MKSGRILNLVVAIATLALGLSAWGQATTSLRGAVTDPSGAAIPNAKVTITNVDTNLSRQTLTTTAGVYNFAAVLPGTYKLTVAAQGFREYVQSGVQLLVSLPSTIDVKLKVGSISQVVSVTGQAPLLNTTNASVGQTMGTSAIENLPLRAESMPLLLSFQPGVVYNGQKPDQLTGSYDTRGGAVNGERSDQNNIMLDGVSDNNEFAGYAFNGVLPTTPFSVQEFRVTTSNYGATEGRSSGAQIAMVTKSGTNQFHGSLYEFNRNTAGEANDYFLKSSESANGQQNVPEHLVRNIFGGTIGGPFMKNRFFFFFNYEGRRESLASTATRTIPSTTLRDGIIQYACDTPASCPASMVTGASGKQYTIAPGFYGLGPAQLKQMDPLGIGPSQVALDYFKTFPTPNNFSVGNIVNYAGYTFAAPTKQSFNWYIARLDYKLTQNGNNTLFFRGTGVDDRSSGTPFLPGAPPESSTVDLSKGFVAGYTGVYGPHWVNSFRFGLTRESIGNIGNSNQPWVYMRGLDQGVTRSNGNVSPVYNIIDTASWIKGSHNFQFGGNFLLVRRNSYTTSNSFSDALTNSDWVDSSGFANQSSPLNPPSSNYPAVSTSFTHSYDFPLAAMMGIASEVDAKYNYRVASATQGSALAQGAPVVRHWATDSYSLFFEDTWQARSNLSVTYGLNYQLMTPITETSGQQVEPNVNMGSWFNQRSINMAKGAGSNLDPVIAFAPAGSSWGKPGMYSSQKRNFAPRIGLAWSPRPTWGWLKRIVGDNKTAIRAGFGVYDDNFGPALALRYDASGSFGISTSLSNPAGTLSVADSPRITSMNVIPTTNSNGDTIMPPAPPSAFPVTYPVHQEAIAAGIDQSLKTPYSYALDLSIQRQLPGGMTLDLAYVGHLAHRLMVYDDIATPLDLVDPKTGVDYFTAASRFSQLARQGVSPSAITASMVGPTASYWNDMFVGPASNSSYNSCAKGSTNVLQASYAWFNCFKYNETLSLWEMDVRNHYPHPAGGENSFYNSQYSSLYVWRSIGYSNYNAFQLGLHKEMSHGVLFGFNYTYSKALDVESAAGRTVKFNDNVIVNPWSPYQLYGPSDFDLRHQLNGYWVAQLPFGRGKLIGGNVANWANAIVGGWQLSGTTRWTSGFPASVFPGYVWPTNWEDMGQAGLTGQPVSTGTTIVNGSPNVFQNPTQAAAGFNYAYPGQSGARNVLRGDGFFGWDMSLAKEWNIPRLENQTVQLRWNVYNVANAHRFDVKSMQNELDVGSTFGNYTTTLTQPRVMEFSLLYKF
jgi:hypothetical protein